LAHKRLTESGKLALGGGDGADQATKIRGLQLVADSDTANVIGYKAGAATAGKEFVELTAVLNTEREWFPPGGVAAYEGWYFTLSGTGVQLHVFYE